MTTHSRKSRMAFSLGLLVASIGFVANSAEPKAGDIIENSIKMKLAFIPPGEFDMGSPKSEKYRFDSEELRHVKLTKGFYLGAYEVTQSQFEKVLGRNPAWFRKDGGGKDSVTGKDTASFPVEQVTWYDAVEFCNTLSKLEDLPEYYTFRNVVRADDLIKSAEVAENGGKGYRLPTEAEWEYACRAGTKTAFHFGDVLDGKNANVHVDFLYGTSTEGPSLNRTREVGSYAPNRFGLYDMHGNAAEWCNDWWGVAPVDGVDPKGPGSGKVRMLRGGSFHNSAQYTRSASRDMAELAIHLDTYAGHDITDGFRVARNYP